MTTLTCPKCAADMRSYERNRVLVDQCTGCGGLFLDRGELEALVTAENAWHQQQDAQSGPGRVQDSPRGGNHQQPVYQQQPAYHQQPAYQQPPAQRYAEAPYRAHSKAHYGQRRKRGFLSDLFDD